MYQPEGIEWFRWKDQDYVITANEGGVVELLHYSSDVFDEAIQGRNIRGIHGILHLPLPPFLSHSLCLLPVSYTHLTLPTIWPV